MSTTDAVTSAPSSTEKMIGCVKWFNNKAGYGFISVIDGDHNGKEIFVHHSGIGVNEQQYKYLVQGEYVEFVLSSTPSESHEFQAVQVTGIRGGKLMCETIYEMKLLRTNYKGKSEDEVQQQEPRSVRPPRTTRSPRKKNTERPDKEWTTVKGPRQGKVASAV